MDLAGWYRPKSEAAKGKRSNREGIVGSHYDNGNLLIIKLPTAMVLRIMSRSLFVAMVIITLPSIGLFLRGSSSSSYDSEAIRLHSADSDLLPLVFNDFVKEGMINKSGRALVLSSNVENYVDSLDLFEEYEIDLVLGSDLGSKSMISDETFDLVFALSCEDGKFEDRVLKIGGLLVMKLSNDPTNAFHQLTNYKIVYVQRFNATIVAMKKIGLSNESTNNINEIHICVQSEAKKAALEGLEEALLEPPHRHKLTKSIDHTNKINFSPDLLGDSLKSYSHRIFITDKNDDGSVLRWFHQNYPKKNQHFEAYELRTGIYDAANMNILALDWFKTNVKEEDFVVMKAKTQFVEQMMKDKSICLVDELFLECELQWEGISEQNNGKRAYWECLALFGKLRKEGVFVHQWWGLYGKGFEAS